MTHQIEDPTVRTLEPCQHMVNAVNGLADGSLRGPMKMYTRLHTLHCSKCRTALHSLTMLHTRLGALSISTDATDRLSPERQSDMARALDDIESTKNGLQ